MHEAQKKQQINVTLGNAECTNKQLEWSIKYNNEANRHIKWMELLSSTYVIHDVVEFRSVKRLYQEAIVCYL